MEFRVTCGQAVVAPNQQCATPIRPRSSCNRASRRRFRRTLEPASVLGKRDHDSSQRARLLLSCALRSACHSGTTVTIGTVRQNARSDMTCQISNRPARARLVSIVLANRWSDQGHWWRRKPHVAADTSPTASHATHQPTACLREPWPWVTACARYHKEALYRRRLGCSCYTMACGQGLLIALFCREIEEEAVRNVCQTSSTVIVPSPATSSFRISVARLFP